MSRISILEAFRAELKTALGWKLYGMTEVKASVAGERVAQGRDYVPIDEYIADWQEGIDAMEAGADQEQFNY